MERKIIKIAVTGPESTGKSELAGQLAEHYGTVWVPEFARSYIGSLQRPYNQEDILLIAKGQIRNERKMLGKAKKFLFCDTELIVTKIWSEVKYQSCHEWIRKKISVNKYDLFLLCNIDLPWEYDPQREHPDKRQYLFDLYRKELEMRAFPYYVISGIGKRRLQNAVRCVDTFIRS